MPYGGQIESLDPVQKKQMREHLSMLPIDERPHHLVVQAFGESAANEEVPGF